MKNYFKTRCISIILIAAGYGWAGGHYIPSDSKLNAYLFQFIVIGILLWLSMNFLSVDRIGGARHWSIRGLSIFSSLSFLVNILNIIHGAVNQDPHSFGSHNTFADLVPIALLIAGSGLWIYTTLPWRKGAG